MFYRGARLSVTVRTRIRWQLSVSCPSGHTLLTPAPTAEATHFWKACTLCLVTTCASQARRALWREEGVNTDILIAGTAARACSEGHAGTSALFSPPGVFPILWQPHSVDLKVRCSTEQAQDCGCPMLLDQLACVLAFLSSYLHRHQECQLWVGKENILNTLIRPDGFLFWESCVDLKVSWRQKPTVLFFFL